MKRCIMLFMVTIFLYSCSSDDKPTPPVVVPTGNSFLKVTIDGTNYNFDTFEISNVNVSQPGGVTYVDLYVIGTMAADNSKSIMFKLEKGGTGTDTIYYSLFTDSATGEFDTDNAGSIFTTDISINVDHNVKGSFSGTLSDSSTTVAFTDGTFDIFY